MAGINVSRWLGGGFLAGLVMWVIEGIGSVLYMDEAQTALEAHNLSMDLSASFMMMTVLVSLIAGLVLIFVYAAIRPRFGPGPRTAVIAAVALWFGGYLLSLIGYGMMGLYPGALLTIWAVIGLVEMILGGLVGGWFYREPGEV